jgi:hypothetical protein
VITVFVNIPTPYSYFLQLSATYAGTQHTHTRARKHTRTQSTAGHAKCALCDALAPGKKKCSSIGTYSEGSRWSS